AQDVAEKDRQQLGERAEPGVVWRAEVEHHDRDQDGDDTIPESLEAVLVHPLHVGTRGTGATNFTDYRSPPPPAPAPLHDAATRVYAAALGASSSPSRCADTQGIDRGDSRSPPALDSLGGERAVAARGRRAPHRRLHGAFPNGPGLGVRDLSSERRPVS